MLFLYHKIGGKVEGVRFDKGQDMKGISG